MSTPFSYTGEPYQFTCLERKKQTTQGSFICDHVYVFRSASGLKYITNIHQYNFGVCAVKFHLKRQARQPNRYKYMSNQPDRIKILKTVIAIMVDYAKKNDDLVSYAFIGMPVMDEAITTTKRFRVYKALSYRYFNSDNFEHMEDPEKSLYMILNKKRDITKLHLSILDCIETDLLAEFTTNSVNPFSSSTSRSHEVC